MILVFGMLSFKPAFLLSSSPSSRVSLVPLPQCENRVSLSTVELYRVKTEWFFNKTQNFCDKEIV